MRLPLAARTLGALLLLLSLAAQASIDQPASQFGWYSWRELTPEDYQAKLDHYTAQGYRPVDFEVRSNGKERRYALVLRKEAKPPKWLLKSQLSHNEFKQLWDKQRKAGYRPVDIESHSHKGKRYYGGLWVKDGIKDWASYRNLSSDDFTQAYEENKKKGRMPIDVDGYVDGKKLKFSGIFVKNSEKLQWSIRRNIKQGDFSSHFDDMTGQDYRLYRLSPYEYNQQLYFAAIWVKDKSPRRWAAKRDMDDQEMRNAFNQYSDAGYRLEDLEAYSHKGKLRFSGVWLENDQQVTRWQHRKAVDKLIADYLDDNPSEGFSLAIWQDGKVLFRKGYGLADRSANKTAHADSVYRYASVAKAVTSVLGFMLEEDKKLTLDSKIRKLISLPKHHDYQLRDLLAIRSGVCHYKNDSNTVCDGFDGTSIDLGKNTSMTSAIKLFKDEDLVTSTGTLFYSTHGYSIAGAAYEKKTKKSFNSLLDSYINQRLGSQITCENLNTNKFDRAAIYWVDDEDGNKIKTATQQSIAWKCPGGGMEGSVMDLIKLGVGLKQNKLMKRANLERMIDPPDDQLRGGNRYAYGWVVNQTSGTTNWYGKEGDQTGGRSYLRVYEDRPLVIALSGNTRGSNYTDLTTAIANLISP